MERLTKVDGCGQNDLIRCFDCNLEKAGENLENCGYCEEGWRKALDRLAAYEDTELEPEEIKPYMNFVEDLIDGQKASEALMRLRELAQADLDGRLVVIPEPDDAGIYDPLEPMKIGFALKSEVKKLEYRLLNRPETVSDLDYTIIAALKKMLEGGVSDGK